MRVAHRPLVTLAALGAAHQVSLGCRPVFEQLRPTGEVTVGLTMLSGAGRVARLEVPREVVADPRVFNFQFVRQVGQVIRRPPQGNDILGYIGTTGRSIEHAVALAEEFFGKVVIDLQPEG